MLTNFKKYGTIGVAMISRTNKYLRLDKALEECRKFDNWFTQYDDADNIRAKTALTEFFKVYLKTSPDRRLDLGGRRGYYMFYINLLPIWKISVTWDEFSFKKCHSQIMEIANSWVENAENNEERILLLNYLIDTILADICTGKLFLPLLTHPKMPLTSPFPNDYYDENGICRTILSEERIGVDLSGSTPVYLCPWNNEKCVNSLVNISKNAFTEDKNNHKSFYYTDIGLCHVYSGNHSINAGRYLKKGAITAEICRTELLYSHFHTDGADWFNSHTNEKILKVSDFRFAAVYSLAQLRASLKNDNGCH